MADSSNPAALEHAAMHALGASDTFENKDTVFVKVDIPGLSKADITVRRAGDCVMSAWIL